MNVIERLKDNKHTVHAGWDDEMKAKADEIGKSEFEFLSSDLGWLNCTCGKFKINIVYRLRQDYEEPKEKPEIVRREIKKDKKDGLEFVSPDNGCPYGSDYLFRYPNFIGVEKDGLLMGMGCVLYKKSGLWYNQIAATSLDKYEVITAEGGHALFRGEK